MEKLYKAGKTKSIGVSNWKISGLEVMLKYAEIKPAVNQVEIHPFFPNTALVEYCFSHDILPVAYSPLGSQGQVATARETLLENAELGALAEKKGVTLAQLLIAWGLKRRCAVLPKSANEERIRRNFHIIELSEEEFSIISKAGEGRHTRFVNPQGMFGYNVWQEESS
jgi:diketogulonate reductase-like aldo/keto reductase